MNEVQGLIISSIDYKEKSKIVYLYTPNGHDSVRASRSKDISSGLLGFTTTLNEVMYVKSNAKFPTVIEYRILDSYFSLTESVSKIQAVRILLEVIRHIPQDSDHSRIYPFVMQTLRDLKEQEAGRVLSVFLIKMLYVFGVTPNLKYCLTCGREGLVFFSIPEGGGYCQTCCQKENGSLLRLWREYYYEKKPITEYTEADYPRLLEGIFRYYAIHVHLQLYPAGEKPAENRNS